MAAHDTTMPYADDAHSDHDVIYSESDDEIDLSQCVEVALDDDIDEDLVDQPSWEGALAETVGLMRDNMKKEVGIGTQDSSNGIPTTQIPACQNLNDKKFKVTTDESNASTIDIGGESTSNGHNEKHNEDEDKKDKKGKEGNSLYIATNDVYTMQLTASQQNLGRAKLRYRLDRIVHGRFAGRPACLIIIDFNFNYDKTCPVTRADIKITFGGENEDDNDEKVNEAQAGASVPFATDLRWPRTAQGPSSDVHISQDATLKLQLGFNGFSVETPSLTRTRSGHQTDSGWRITGSPITVSKPFPCQRRYLWRVSGNDLNNYPVPEEFSLGMVVLHNQKDFWAVVNIDGALRHGRGSLRDLAQKWNKLPPRLWRIRADDDPTVELDDQLVRSTVGAKYKTIFRGLQIVDNIVPEKNEEEA